MDLAVKVQGIVGHAISIHETIFLSFRDIRVKEILAPLRNPLAQLFRIDPPSSSQLKNAIKSKMFEIVIATSDLDYAIVMLSRAFCWDASLFLCSNKAEPKAILQAKSMNQSLSDWDRDAITQFMDVDMPVFQHYSTVFHEILKTEVGFVRDVLELRASRDELERECASTISSPKCQQFRRSLSDSRQIVESSYKVERNITLTSGSEPT
jgi:hypothetical protein